MFTNYKDGWAQAKTICSKKSDSEYDRKKNNDVTYELCGVKLKYTSLARHFKWYFFVQSVATAPYYSQIFFNGTSLNIF